MVPSFDVRLFLLLFNSDFSPILRGFPDNMEPRDIDIDTSSK